MSGRAEMSAPPPLLCLRSSTARLADPGPQPLLRADRLSSPQPHTAQQTSCGHTPPFARVLMLMFGPPKKPQLLLLPSWCVLLECLEWSTAQIRSLIPKN